MAPRFVRMLSPLRIARNPAVDRGAGAMSCRASRGGDLPRLPLRSCLAFRSLPSPPGRMFRFLSSVFRLTSRRVSVPAFALQRLFVCPTCRRWPGLTVAGEVGPSREDLRCLAEGNVDELPISARTASFQKAGDAGRWNVREWITRGTAFSLVGRTFILAFRRLAGGPPEVEDPLERTLKCSD